MAKVETIENIDQTLRPINQTVLTSQASADAFGASAYAGLGDVARGLGKASDTFAALQKITDDTAVKKALVGAAGEDRDHIINYQATQGATAVSGKDGALKAIDDTTKKWSDGLTPAQLNAYQMARAERAVTTKGSVLEHGTKAMVADTVDTSQAMIDSAQNDVITYYKDPKRQKAALDSGIAEIDKMAPVAGLNGERVKAMKLEFTSKAYAGVITRLAEDDPIAAQKYLEAHRDGITGITQAKLDDVLKEGVLNEQSKRETSAILEREKGVPADAAGDSGDLAARLIRSKEGWTPGKWDVNHWRVGYSSDTVTKEDGSVEKVTPGTTVSKADAERDLARRLDEQERVYKSRGGEENWNKLSAGAKAAAQSVAWNYGIDGSAPRDIMAAIARGEGDEGVARAIKNHRHDNGGINANRRDQEADLAVGGHFSGGVMQSLTASERLQRRQDALDAISNPDLRALTQKRLDALDAAQAKALEADQKDAKSQLWKIIDNGGTPDDATPDLRQRAGMAATQEAWSYVTSAQQRGAQKDIISDEATLYSLRKQAAQDPDGFSQIDLLNYRSKLSKADLAELEGHQTSYFTDKHKKADDNLSIDTAFTMATTSLKAAGVVGQARDNDPAAKQLEAQKEAAFNNALADSMADFKKKHGVNPSQMDIQMMINRQLMPIIMRTTSPGYIAGERTDDEPGHFLFEMRTAPDNVRAIQNLTIDKIDRNTRTVLSQDFQRRFGRAPSQDELIQAYVDFLTRTY